MLYFIFLTLHLRAPHSLARLANVCCIEVLSHFTGMLISRWAGKKLKVAVSEGNIITDLKQS